MNIINRFVVMLFIFSACYNVSGEPVLEYYFGKDSLLHGDIKAGRYIYIGDTLKITNNDDTPHQLQDKLGLFFDTGLLNPGTSFEYQFTKKIPYFNDSTNLPLILVDQISPTKTEYSFIIRDKAVLIFPKNSWFLASQSIELLILFGQRVNTSVLPVVYPDQVEYIEMIIDGKKVFSGTYNDELLSINKETYYGHFDRYQTINGGEMVTQQGHNAYIFKIPPNSLMEGVHSFKVSVKLDDGQVREDEVMHTILKN